MRLHHFICIIATLSQPALGGEGASEIFDTLDTNSDKMITFEEFRAGKRMQSLPVENVQKLFSRFDKNSDGTLSPSELKRRKHKARRSVLPGQKEFQQLDVDSSGDLTLEELQAFELFSQMRGQRQSRLFKRIDRDQSGAATAAEMRKVRANMMKRGQQRRLVNRLDADGDQIITTEEFESSDFIQKLPEEKKRALFQKLDRNKDGKLDASDAPRKKKRGRKDQRGK